MVPHPSAVTKFIPQGMGWIPDLPDARDYTFRHQSVIELLSKKLERSRHKQLPEAVDLRCGDEGERFFTEPEDEGPLNSSTAFAVLSLVEYFERRTRGRTFEGSKLFLYQATRHRLHKRPRMGDTGADLRTTLKTLVQIGVPPEEYWPYDVDKCDDEPSPFLYSLAKPPPGVRYFRLDAPNRDGATTWEAVKSFLAAGFPIAFGFSVPASLTTDAEVPYRPHLDSIRGGQAAVAIGYENHHFGRGQPALLIRNSWGSQWGDNGNGWLPVGFVRHQLAKDFWTLMSSDWLDADELFRPSSIESS